MIEGLPFEEVNGVNMTLFEGVAGCRLYLINTMEEWKAFYALAWKEKYIASDTETSGFSSFHNGNRIVGMSFGWRDTHFYIPVRHVDSLTGGTQVSQLSMDDLRPDLQKLFARKDLITIWHNRVFDVLFYAADGIDAHLCKFHDTLFMWKLIDENAPAALKKIASGWRDTMGRWHKGIVHKDAAKLESEIGKWRGAESRARRTALNALVRERAVEMKASLEHSGTHLNQLKKLAKLQFADHPYAINKKDEIHYGYVPIPLMCEYAGLDTFLTYKIFEYCIAILKEDKARLKIYKNELQLSEVIFDMSLNGVLIDRDYLLKTEAIYNKEIEKLITQVRIELCASELNLNSDQQLARAFQAMGVPLTKTTDKGALSMDRAVLEDLERDGVKAATTLLRYRKLVKLRDTYCTGVIKQLTEDNYLHPTFNQNVNTGRMSCRSPNLQNLPAKDTTIRRAFICEPGDYIQLYLDYSQIEVRLTAHYSNDDKLIQAYVNEEDIHLLTCCEVFGTPYEEGKKIWADDTHTRYGEIELYRKISKTIVFLTVYGGSAGGLATKIPRPSNCTDYGQEQWVEECQLYLNRFFDRFPGVKRFILTSGAKAKRDRQVVSSFGRIRHLPEVDIVKITGDYSKKWIAKKAQRQATNFFVQSAAADIMKYALVRVHKILKGSKSRITNTVHDEIQLLMHKDDVHLLPAVKQAMEDFNFRVPMVADVEVSDTNWADKKKTTVEKVMETYRSAA